MLEALPWPQHLTKVPEYAGGHHERMDGKGYPKGLTREQMSVQARCMGIADIFEALTAKRPALQEGQDAVRVARDPRPHAPNNHVDPDLFDVFVRRKGVPALRRDVPRPGADRRRGRDAHSRAISPECSKSAHIWR
jgi:HD-GYP domain-containing protein (c-di-GMP phosphodiesterase class II)